MFLITGKQSIQQSISINYCIDLAWFVKVVCLDAIFFSQLLSNRLICLR